MCSDMCADAVTRTSPGWSSHIPVSASVEPSTNPLSSLSQLIVTDDDRMLQVAGVVESAKVVRDGRWAEVRIPRLDLVERELAVAVRIVEAVELFDGRFRVP